MGKWDVISDVIGNILAPVIGPAIGEVVEDALKPPESFLPATPPPTEATGRAAEASAAHTRAVSEIMSELSELDNRSGTTLQAVIAAQRAAAQQLGEIQQAIEQKISDLGDKLDTRSGQDELRTFLEEKLLAAKQVLEEHYQLALESSRQTADLTEEYENLGPRRDGGESTEGIGPGGGSAEPTPPVGPDPGATAPASSSTPVAPPVAPGMAPPMGMPATGAPSVPMPAMPMGGSPGGGAMADPFGALAGLGDRSASDARRADDERRREPDTHDDRPTDPQADTEPAREEHQDGESPGNSTEVTLPDGSVAHAPDPRAAVAVRAALGGADVAAAYQQAGITVSPPGTPVRAPIVAADLMAGDVGVWKDHLLMALGDSKVLVAGKIEPQESVVTGPDFLGWMRPTLSQPPPEPAQTRPPEPPGH
jgi:hypothetical protein